LEETTKQQTTKQTGKANSHEVRMSASPGDGMGTKYIPIFHCPLRSPTIYPPTLRDHDCYVARCVCHCSTPCHPTTDTWSTSHRDTNEVLLLTQHTTYTNKALSPAFFALGVEGGEKQTRKEKGKKRACQSVTQPASRLRGEKRKPPCSTLRSVCACVRLGRDFHLFP